MFQEEGPPSQPCIPCPRLSLCFPLSPAPPSSPLSSSIPCTSLSRLHCAPSPLPPFNRDPFLRTGRCRQKSEEAMEKAVLVAVEATFASGNAVVVVQRTPPRSPGIISPHSVRSPSGRAVPHCEGQPLGTSPGAQQALLLVRRVSGLDTLLQDSGDGLILDTSPEQIAENGGVMPPASYWIDPEAARTVIPPPAPCPSPRPIRLGGLHGLYGTSIACTEPPHASRARVAPLRLSWRDWTRIVTLALRRTSTPSYQGEAPTPPCPPMLCPLCLGGALLPVCPKSQLVSSLETHSSSLPQASQVNSLLDRPCSSSPSWAALPVSPPSLLTPAPPHPRKATDRREPGGVGNHGDGY